MRGDKALEMEWISMEVLQQENACRNDKSSKNSSEIREKKINPFRRAISFESKIQAKEVFETTYCSRFSKIC